MVRAPETGSGEQPQGRPMLDLLRRGVRSWVAKVLLGLLVASFAVWGIGDIGAGFSTRVATVGDRAVEADAFARRLRSEQQRFGLDPSMIRASGLDRFVLAGLVREAALAEAAAGLGVSAPDSAVARTVRSDPSFLVGGQFDATQYQNAVRRVYPSVGAFEETVRRSLASALISEAALLGATPPPGMAEAIARFSEERRVFDILTLTADAHAGETPEPDDAALAAHLEAHPERFTDPERRDVTWLHIDLAALARGVEVPEEEVRALYEEERDRLATPERRAVDQIVFDEAAAAEAALARIEAGETDFDGLLAERGLTRRDASLGVVTRRDLRGERADVAFRDPAPGVVGPAPAAGGFALLDVREITPGSEVPFETVRDDLAAELGAERARPEADRIAEAVEDLRAGGATIEEAAGEFDLAFGRIAGLAGDGSLPGGARADGLVASDAFLDEAFAAEPGAERRMAFAPDGGYFLVRVDAVTPPATPPLDAIRDRVAEDWRAEARRAALAEAAEGARARIAEGESVEAVAADLGVTPGQAGPIRRQDPEPRIGETARAALFAGEPGTVAVTATPARAVVAVLREVRPADDAGALAGSIRRALAASVAEDQAELLGRALEDAAGVRFNPSVLDSVISQVGG
ncbi:MAG: hypothetical protein EA355_03925 [Rhodobacteraceae bacterium]|nr:MAG: hypothetical protein EA355_03925 [Paracoccaceae bacterium]